VTGIIVVVGTQLILKNISNMYYVNNFMPNWGCISEQNGGLLISSAVSKIIIKPIQVLYELNCQS